MAKAEAPAKEKNFAITIESKSIRLPETTATAVEAALLAADFSYKGMKRGYCAPTLPLLKGAN